MNATTNVWTLFHHRTHSIAMQWHMADGGVLNCHLTFAPQTHMSREKKTTDKKQQHNTFGKQHGNGTDIAKCGKFAILLLEGKKSCLPLTHHQVYTAHMYTHTSTQTLVLCLNSCTLPQTHIHTHTHTHMHMHTNPNTSTPYYHVVDLLLNSAFPFNFPTFFLFTLHTVVPVFTKLCGSVVVWRTEKARKRERLRFFRMRSGCVFILFWCVW